MAPDPGIVVLAILFGVLLVGWLIDHLSGRAAAQSVPAERTELRMPNTTSRTGADDGGGLHGAEQPRERLTSEAPAVEAPAHAQETATTPGQIVKREWTDRVGVFKPNANDGP